MRFFVWATLAATGAISCRGAIATDSQNGGGTNEVTASRTAERSYETANGEPAPVTGPNPIAAAEFEILHSGLWVQLEPTGTEDALIESVCPECPTVILGRSCVPDERFVRIRTAHGQVRVACDAFAAFAWTGERAPLDVLRAFAGLPSSGSEITPIRESGSVSGAQEFNVTAENIRLVAYAKHANSEDRDSGLIAMGRWRMDADAELNAADVAQMVRNVRQAAE